MRVAVMLAALTACQPDVIGSVRTGSGHDGCTSYSDHTLYTGVHETITTEYLSTGELLTEAIARYENDERVAWAFL